MKDQSQIGALAAAFDARSHIADPTTLTASERA